MARWPMALAAVSGVLLGLRAVVAANTGLTDDEAYYRLWGLAPALSYLDHPPLAGWLIAAGQWLAGDTSLGLRLAAVLAPLLGAVLALRTGTLLFGAAVGTQTAWLTLAMPLLAAGGVVMTPDVPSVLCWGLTGWAVAELYRSGRADWWLAVGLFAGLGLLAKYSNLFVGAGIVLWLLLSPQARRWWMAWQLWAGGAIAVLCTGPVLWWNFIHHGASFSKQFGRVGAGEWLTLRFMGELAGAMAGLLSPAIAVLAVIGLLQTLQRARRDRDGPEVLLLCSIIPFASYLLVHCLHDRVQANWPAPLFPALGMLAALAMTASTRQKAAPNAAFWAVRRLALPLGFGLSGLIYLHALHPFVQLSGDRDPTSQMRGWPQFARDVEVARTAMGTQWIATSSFETTGQLAFALPSGPPVVQLDERLRYIHLPPVADTVLRAPALYVELQRRADLALLRARFAAVEAAGTLTRSSGGVSIGTYVLYKVGEPIGAVLPPPE